MVGRFSPIRPKLGSLKGSLKRRRKDDGEENPTGRIREVLSTVGSDLLSINMQIAGEGSGRRMSRICLLCLKHFSGAEHGSPRGLCSQSDSHPVLQQVKEAIQSEANSKNFSNSV